MFRNPNPDPKVQGFIDQALSYVGYRALSNRVNAFGEKVGYNGVPWSGAFVDVVAREVGISIPACVYTPVAISEFARLNQVFTRPRPGDIVFLSLAADGLFSMPQCGIVVSVDRWDATGFLEVVEGDTRNPAPRADATDLGVFRRTRHRSEVLLFARPVTGRRPARGASEVDGSLPRLNPRVLTPGRKGGQVTVLQLALAARGHACRPTGTLDAETRLAYAQFQRAIGYTTRGASGLPDASSLRRLAFDTNLFTLAD